jgi:hypothetical protein
MSKLAKALTAAAGNAGGDNLYVEDVFSTYLYDGTGTATTITNNVDLDGEGGLVWLKNRSQAQSNYLFDTENGANKFLISDLTAAISTVTNRGVTAFNSNGFDLGSSVAGNRLGDDFSSWTFRKAEKFFDVVTYTGDGTLRNIPHNLGSTPAVIIVKTTSNTGNWYVQHTSLGPTKSVFLDTTSAATTRPEWGNTAPTDSVFTVDGTTVTATNYSGRTYVAYLFASDAGGFGDDGSESIIKCGSYTGNGNSDGPDINLGFEAQWVMIKRTDASGNDWVMMDIMRGMPMDSGGAYLRANLSNAEAATAYMQPTPTGLKVRGTGSAQANANGATYIYIAIRRPMKTPESGTEVFMPNDVDNGASSPDSISGFPVDMYFRRYVNTTNDTYLLTRLTSPNALKTNGTDAEAAFSSSSAGFDYQNGVMNIFSSDNSDFHTWMFKRATGFMDVVAYSGNQPVNTQINHNLKVAPEFIIIKNRTADNSSWVVQHSGLPEGIGQGASSDYVCYLNSANAAFDTDGTFNFAPTSTTFTLSSQNSQINDTVSPIRQYIAYLFATLAGVSKVGSYTGNGGSSVQQIDCGFSSGARFILIKDVDGTNDWYFWDTARGIVAGNDPYLRLNQAAAENPDYDWVDPYSAGFEVTTDATGAFRINVSGRKYIFLAIA